MGRIDEFMALGAGTSAQYWFGKMLQKMPIELAHREIRLHPPLSATPVSSRLASSDLAVFKQIFIENEYQCLGDISDPKHIIDCGANVGYSTVYFLTRFPNVKVVAIEPDPSNFAQLLKNTSPFGDRVTCLNVGIWSRDARLAIKRDVGDGMEWSFQVEEVKDSEPADVDAMSIATVLKKMRWSHVDLLKVDIEGAESELFADPSQEWLSKVGAVVIELHGEEAKRIVTDALKQYTKQTVEHGELTFFDIA